MNRLALRQVLRASPVYRPQPVRIPSTTVTLIQSRLATSVTQTSFWKSLIPKPLRRSEPEPNFGPKKSLKKPKSNEWNPATFFIIIFLLIGSMSIQMISLKKDFATFMRQADVRIGLLREVIEKIQKGEEVDVEKVLGTGDPERELAWEDVVTEILKDEAMRDPRAKKTEKVQPPVAKPDTPSKQEPTTTESKPVTSGTASFF